MLTLCDHALLMDVDKYMNNQYGFEMVMMKRTVDRKLFIISKFQRDINWIHDFTENYLVYNTGTPIEDSKTLNVTNYSNGSNQKYMFQYFCDNWDNLPNLMVFTQDYPFDHCKRKKFEVLVNNTYFTPLEDYGTKPSNGWEERDRNTGFLERNNSWYIDNNNRIYHISCRYKSFDEFMHRYFKNYSHLDWLRFCPGCQYIVEKNQVLQYPKEFWYKLLNEIDKFGSTEAHIIERALMYILKGTYTLK